MKIGLFSIILFCAALAHADQFAEIDIQAQFDPAKALGIVMGPEGSAQKSDVTWSRVSETTITVKVPITAGELKRESFVTAMVMSSEGQAAFGPVKSTSDQASLDSILSLPECPGKEIAPGLETQAGQMQSLVEIRTLRRENYQRKIKNKFNQDFLNRLRTLEQGFGISRGTALGPDLHPLEMSDRLTRLADAIRNYKRQESANATAKAATPKNE